MSMGMNSARSGVALSVAAPRTPSEERIHRERKQGKRRRRRRLSRVVKVFVPDNNSNALRPLSKKVSSILQNQEKPTPLVLPSRTSMSTFSAPSSIRGLEVCDPRGLFLLEPLLTCSRDSSQPAPLENHWRPVECNQE
jgi:hypothetical protein